MKYIISIGLGYLLGCFNFAYITSSLKGFDIRKTGSGNAGASNIKLALGWKYFALVSFLDISKSLLAVLLVRYLYHDQLLTVLAGSFAVIGHCFPFYMGFKGGKGYASSIGFALGIDFRFFFVLILISLIFALLFKYICIATYTLTLTLPIYSYCHNDSLPVLLIFITLSAIIFYRHKINFIRFFNGEEINNDGKKIGIKLHK